MFVVPCTSVLTGIKIIQIEIGYVDKPVSMCNVTWCRNCATDDKEAKSSPHHYPLQWLLNACH